MDDVRKPTAAEDTDFCGILMDSEPDVAPVEAQPSAPLSDAAKQWVRENEAAIRAWNERLAREGMPLDHLRRR